MVIFNQEVIENSYTIKDNEILQIESRLGFREFVQKLQNTLAGRDGPLLPEDFTLSVYRSGPLRQVTLLWTDYNETDMELYLHTFDPENESGLDEMETQSNDKLLHEFERYTYGQNHDFIHIPQEAADLQAVYESCLDACGIMPTLYGNMDAPVKYLQDISYMGRSLYFPWENLNRANRLPEADILELFYSISPYERAAITDSLHNPTHIMDVLKAARAIPGYNNYIVTQQFVKAVAGGDRTCCSEDLVPDEGFLEYAVGKVEAKDTPDYQALNDAFVEAFRRAPRVLPEIYDAYLHAYGVDSLSEAQAKEIVSKFRLTNIQKVAGNHNPALLVLAGELNFDEIKKEHLQIFATYLTASDYAYLKKNGFFEWYARYKGEVKTADLCTIVKKIKELDFDLSLPPKQILALKSQVLGWCNAACVAHDYHGNLDFRNAVVAIPGRGLVVEDKAAHIRMRILPPDDSRIFTAPLDCHCCQNLAMYSNIRDELLAQHFKTIDEAYQYVEEHFEEDTRLTGMGAGASCVANELTNPLAWVTLWEDTNTGDTVAQADTHYVLAQNTLVYDNIEFVNDGNVKKIYDIIAAYAQASTFSSIHVGTGYNQQMKSFGKRIATKEMVHYTEDLTEEFKNAFGSRLYSDYHSDAIKVKQNGEMLIWPKKPDRNFTIHHEPEDNEAFRYLLHPVSAAFYHYTPSAKYDLIARYEAQSLTVEELETVAQSHPELLKDYEVLPLSVQKLILYNGSRANTGEPLMNPEMFQYIRHPDSLLIKEALKERVSNIIYFDSENTTRENWESVLPIDGSLIEYCPKKFWDEELLILAIKNNPFSIKYVANDLEEPLRSKMIRMAVYKKPILTAHFPDLPEYLWIQICELKGQFGKYCLHQTPRIQEAMVNSSPYNIDYIHTPERHIVEKAALAIPSLRNNPRYASYFAVCTPNCFSASISQTVQQIQNRDETNDPEETFAMNEIA